MAMMTIDNDYASGNNNWDDYDDCDDKNNCNEYNGYDPHMYWYW